MKAMKEAKDMTGKKDMAGVAVMKAVGDMEKVTRKGGSLSIFFQEISNLSPYNENR